MRDAVKEWSDGDAVVTVRATGRTELTCRYESEDVACEVVISLPSSYPLRTATVDMHSRAGSEGMWRRWYVCACVSCFEFSRTL